MAWHPLGWSPAFFAEIEKFPSAVLAHHYGSNMPDEEPSANGVPNLGDMTKFKEWPDAAIDVLVGGTPCQSFSVAGLRKGLADPRGNLALTYLAIADRYRPRWVVWENVPGVLSSNGGRDFGAFLGGLVELGYGFAYRVLDAQYVRVDGFGRAVPQRRRRVFVVGYLGDWRRAAAVLFEQQSLSGDSAPRREAGQRTAGTVAGGARASGGYSTDDIPLTEKIVADVASTLPAGGNATGGDRQPGTSAETAATMLVAHPLLAKGNDSHAADMDNYVAHSLRGEGFDAGEDGTGRGTPIIPIAIQERAISENADAGPDGIGVRADGAAYTLEARQVPQAVAHPYTLAVRGRGDGHQLEYRQDGTANAILTPNGGRAGIGVGAIAFSAKDYGADASEEVAPTLRAGGHTDSHPNAGVMPAIAFTTEQEPKWSEGVAPTIKQPSPTGGGQPTCVQSGWAVRRLTPTECERLQGFPDGFTDIPWRKARAADGPRYKALGNSMAVNVMRWIGRRIELVESIQSEAEAA